MCLSFLNGSVDKRITEGRIIFYGYGYVPIRSGTVFNGYGYGSDPIRICRIGYGSQCIDPRITADNRKMGQIRAFLDKMSKNVLLTAIFTYAYKSKRFKVSMSVSEKLA